MTISSEAAVSVPSMPLEQLEARLVELAGQIAGAQCEFLLLVGEFDAVEGWRSWGLGSTASWLSWKCGVGLAAAREQVRVARTLRELPDLVPPFAAGRLSYSKVRAITRVATEDNLATLIEWGLANPAAVLERLVAAARRSVDADDAQRQHATRRLSYHWDEDGCLVGSFRLPPAEGAQLLVALDAAKAALPDPDPEVEAVDDAATPACEQCVEVNGPELARLACPDVSAETLEHHRPTKNTADALVFLALTGFDQLKKYGDDPTPLFGLPGLDGEDRYQLVIHHTVDGGAEIENGPPLPNLTSRRLSCSCPYSNQTEDLNGNPLHLGRKTRRIRGRLARAVHRRDGGRCRAPGCNRRTAEIHHIVHWEDGGPTCLDNLISLCASHHYLVHDGGWHITFLAPQRWLFERPDGTPVPPRGVLPLRLEPLPHNESISADAVDVRWDGNSDISGAVEWLGRQPTRPLDA